MHDDFTDTIFEFCLRRRFMLFSDVLSDELTVAPNSIELYRFNLVMSQWQYTSYCYALMC